MSLRRIHRRLGQGMTEYIIIVGLVAILLIAAVQSFSTQVDVTIRGTNGKGGMSGGVGDVGNDINNGGGGNNPPAPPPPATNHPECNVTTPTGQPLYSDGTNLYTDPAGSSPYNGPTVPKP